MRVCVCACVCASKKERERESERDRQRTREKENETESEQRTGERNIERLGERSDLLSSEAVSTIDPDDPNAVRGRVHWRGALGCRCVLPCAHSSNHLSRPNIPNNP